MGSPNGRRSADLCDAVQAAEDRAVADFLPSAGSCTGQLGGDGRSAAVETGPSAAALSNGLPVTAADVADRIVALRGAGESPILIAMALHVTIGEVRSVLRDAERPPGTPHHGGLMRPR